MTQQPANTGIERAREVVQGEIDGLQQLKDFLGPSIAAAAQLCLAKPGRLIVTGVGKSGLIGAKLAATFASTGQPSFFLHAAEAAHGDLGMVVAGDVVLAISWSGNSGELYAVIDFCKSNDVPLIGMCSRADSRLGKASTVLLELPPVGEVCPNNLAPTTSATVTLALGHVLAVLMMDKRSFAATDFAQFHPGGRLGLLLQTVGRYVEEHGQGVPTVPENAGLEDVIGQLSSGGIGCVVVEDAQGDLAGLVTEGDLRRAYSPDMFGKVARDIMTMDPTVTSRNALMREVVTDMTAKRIAHILVVDGNHVIDVLHTKDLMQQGYL
jgi:arabinose-5-phosphate isomerase